MVEQINEFYTFTRRRHVVRMIDFPRVELADEQGFLCTGGNFAPTTLKRAYEHGIFPWPNADADLIWWFSPKERFVLYPDQFHVPTSLRRSMKHHSFELRVDTAFRQVMEACAASERPEFEGESGSPKHHDTWILHDMIDGYEELHHQGMAHSIEAWQNNELVGGLYGVSVGALFCGESMFTKVNDASKTALATFVPIAQANGIQLIDCQAYTNNLARFGAIEIPQSQFIDHLNELRCINVDWLKIKSDIEATNHV